jgi:lipoate-protein ligase A
LNPVIYSSAREGISREAELLACGLPGVLIWTTRSQALVIPGAWARMDPVRNLDTHPALTGWPILARKSGGGAVPQGSFTLNLAMTLPLGPDFRIENGYDLVCGTLAEALSRFTIMSGTGKVAGAFCDGAWNVTADGRKLAGTAQRWHTAAGGGRIGLCHAAVLLEPLPETVWPALEALHRAAGQRDVPERSAHVSLSELISGTMRVASFAGALARAAEDRLSRALTARQRVTRVFDPTI